MDCTPSLKHCVILRPSTLLLKTGPLGVRNGHTAGHTFHQFVVQVVNGNLCCMCCCILGVPIVLALDKIDGLQRSVPHEDGLQKRLGHRLGKGDEQARTWGCVVVVAALLCCRTRAVIIFAMIESGRNRGVLREVGHLVHGHVLGLHHRVDRVMRHAHVPSGAVWMDPHWNYRSSRSDCPWRGATRLGYPATHRTAPCSIGCLSGNLLDSQGCG
mmetsp:Transcript_14170/g.25273  ORF Transcript_14170/g.25273 Transcript_14170/m.25273 type:complete len:214 (-) Transcript_14170:539-1180(-)